MHTYNYYINVCKIKISFQILWFMTKKVTRLNYGFYGLRFYDSYDLD